jgi:hypothetical protein
MRATRGSVFLFFVSKSQSRLDARDRRARRLSEARDENSDAMTNTSCTIRTRKFMTNRLLQRRQFVRVARASEPERASERTERWGDPAADGCVARDARGDGRMRRATNEY